MTKIEEKKLRIWITKLEKQVVEMTKLSTRKGFYCEYFNELKNVKTNKEAFNNVNEKYQHLFGNYRYSDFFEFQKLTNFHNNA